MKVNITELKGIALANQIKNTAQLIKQCEKERSLQKTVLKNYNTLIEQIQKDAPTLSIETLKEIIKKLEGTIEPEHLKIYTTALEKKQVGSALSIYKTLTITPSDSQMSISSPSSKTWPMNLEIENLTGLKLAETLLAAILKTKQYQAQSASPSIIKQSIHEYKGLQMLAEKDAMNLKQEEIEYIISQPKLKTVPFIIELYTDALNIRPTAFKP